LPGAGIGALGGGIGGGISGLIGSIFADDAADAAKSGAIDGAIAGPLSGGGAVCGKIYRAGKAARAASQAATAVAGEAGGGIPEALLAKLLEGAEASVGNGTAAGNALQKHAASAGSWFAGKAFGGNCAKNAAAARDLLKDVLENGTVSESAHKVFGDVIKVRLQNGAGAWWKKTGEFIGWLEPYTPRTPR
jgi:hypothetical protein